MIDSQSVKTTESGGIRGFDAGTKINERKRQIVVDTRGLMVALVIRSAGIHDRDSAPDMLKCFLKRCPWFRHIFADCGVDTQDYKSNAYRLETVKRSDPR